MVRFAEALVVAGVVAAALAERSLVVVLGGALGAVGDRADGLSRRMRVRSLRLARLEPRRVLVIHAGRQVVHWPRMCAPQPGHSRDGRLGMSLPAVAVCVHDGPTFQT